MKTIAWIWIQSNYSRFTDIRLIRTFHYYGQFALSLGKESPYIFSNFNPLNSDTFCGLLSVRIRLIVLIGYRAGKKGISLLTAYGFQKVSFWPYNIFLLTELVRSRWLGFSWPLSFLSVIIDFDFVSVHKNAKQKKLSQYPPSLIINDICEQTPRGKGWGGRKPPSVPLLHPILELVRRQWVRKVHFRGFFRLLLY